MCDKPVKKQVSELFGYPADSLHPDAQTSRRERRCPFQRDSTGLPALCTKPSQHTLFLQHRQPPLLGACSVWHRGRGQGMFRPAIICPIRFTQSNSIFRDAKVVLEPQHPENRFLVVDELSLELGRLDYVLVNYDPRKSEVVDFCVLEVMALSTTGTGQVILSMFEKLGLVPPRPKYNYGLNLRQVVSRMIIQMLAKSYATDKWGKVMIWSVQDILFDYMMSTTQLDLTEISIDAVQTAKLPIVFFVYSLQTGGTGLQYPLELGRIVGGYREDIERVLEPMSVPSLDQMHNLMLDRITRGDCRDLTGDVSFVAGLQ